MYIRLWSTANFNFVSRPSGERKITFLPLCDIIFCILSLKVESYDIALIDSTVSGDWARIVSCIMPRVYVIQLYNIMDTLKAEIYEIPIFIVTASYGSVWRINSRTFIFNKPRQVFCSWAYEYFELARRHQLKNKLSSFNKNVRGSLSFSLAHG